MIASYTSQRVLYDYRRLHHARLCMKHSGELFIQDVDTYPILAAASMPLYVALQCTLEYMVHEHLEDYDDGLIYL